MIGPAERPYRRRIHYIHKAFQRSFILKFCLIALCAMMAASLLLYFLSKNTLTATYRYHHLALERTGEAILPALVITNVVVLLVLLAATVLVTLYVSHKIGGPLYRLSKTLESIGDGNLAFPVKLREHDQLTDFASAVEQMMGNLKERVLQIQHELDMVKEKAQREDWNQDEIRRDLERLHQKVHQLFETGGKGN